MAKIKRILLECTHTYETDLNTGIQRVVRNIIKESKQISCELNVKCQPIIFKRGVFLSVDKKKGMFLIYSNAMTLLKKKYWEFRLFLSSIRNLRKIVRCLFPGPLWSCLNAIINFALDILMFPGVLATYTLKEEVPQEGDLLLMLDSSWSYRIWPTVKNAKSNKVIVGTVIYDLFPITHPQFCVPELVECFQQWFSQAVETSDFFIAISQAIRDEVQKYVKSHNPSGKWDGRFESFQLGSVIDKAAKSDKIRDELKEIFESSDKQNTYLAVGTIEPRKNHKYLMDAFDEVWKECPNARLCIVGRIGWLCEGTVKRIKTHSKYGKYLFIFKDLSDTELDYCYSHAKVLVYPSHAEGFGLPLVEGLYKGLPVLASDIPVFREVGKDFCTYFDISQPASLAKIIIDIENEGKMPEVRNPKEYQLLDWKDSCRELLSKAVALYEKVSV